MSQMMTLEEKGALIDAAQAAEALGDYEEAWRLRKQLPLSPNLAKGLLESIGAEALVASGCNLSAAEEIYGKDWLHK